MISSVCGLVHEEVGEAVDAGFDAHPGGVHGQGVGNGQHAEALGLGDARVQGGLVEHGQAGVALDAAVVDHELDVVGAGSGELADDVDRLFGGGDCAHDRVDPLRARRGGRPDRQAAAALRVEVLREQLLGVPARRGDAESGGAHIGEGVVVA